MGVKISELPAATALAGTEPLPLVQSAETRKATVADIAPVRSVAGKTGTVTLDPADCGAAALAHTHTGTYEPALGNPGTNGYVLSSTTGGIRSWVSGGGSPGLVLLATASASDVAYVDFTGIDSTYDEYEVHIQNAIPATDARQLTIRTSSNGGSSFDSGASDYYYSFQIFNLGNLTLSSANAAAVYLSNPTGNATNELGFSGTVHIIRPAISQYENMWWSGIYTTDSAALYHTMGVGKRSTAAAVNAIRFLFSSGNIASGEFKLYGLKKSL